MPHRQHLLSTPRRLNLRSFFWQTTTITITTIIVSPFTNPTVARAAPHPWALASNNISTRIPVYNGAPRKTLQPQRTRVELLTCAETSPRQQVPLYAATGRHPHHRRLWLSSGDEGNHIDGWKYCKSGQAESTALRRESSFPLVS